MKEKKVEMLHKPELTKSSCNHCIEKANKKHEKAIGSLAHSSVASNGPSGIGASSATKASALNHAATEFLSVSPSEGQLPINFSMS